MQLKFSTHPWIHPPKIPLADLWQRSSKRPSGRSLAPLFANGTNFATTLRVLNTLSFQATKMMHPNTDSDANANTLTSAQVGNNAQAGPAAPNAPAPYLQAARSAPRPISRLAAIVPHQQAPPPIATDMPLAPKFVQHVSRTAARMMGYESKRFMRVKADRPLNGPAQFRNALNIGGFPGTSVVIPTAHNDVLYVCAAESALGTTAEAYKRFKEVSRRAGIAVPNIHTELLDELTPPGMTDNELRAMKMHLQAEVQRLDSELLNWRPKFYFAQRIRAEIAKIDARLNTTMELDNEDASPERPNKRPHNAHQSQDAEITPASPSSAHANSPSQ